MFTLSPPRSSSPVIKDYVTQPKPNGYQSLHALVQRATQRRLALDTRVDRRASVVKVEVERSPRGVCILQSRSGRGGFDPATLKSFGLLRVRRRGRRDRGSRIELFRICGLL